MSRLRAPAVTIATALVGALLTIALAPAAHAAGAPVLPNFQTLPARDLLLTTSDNAVYNNDPALPSPAHKVLAFSNSTWNAGAGKFVLTAHIDKSNPDPSTWRGTAYQHVFDANGVEVSSTPVGTIYYHPIHNHYHFEGWGRFELWTKTAYDAWVAAGRPSLSTSAQQPTATSPKTTSCVIDEEPIQGLPGTPALSQFSGTGCQVDANNNLTMGLSPGWGDTYDWYRPLQWIDLGTNSLGDGQYVIRSVANPLGSLQETAATDDEATRNFSVTAGRIADDENPTGTLWINGLQPQTANPTVDLEIVGRAKTRPASGTSTDRSVNSVTDLRVSNDGSHWSSWTSYMGAGGSDSDPAHVSWDITNATYGGNSTKSTKTVFVQVRDWNGLISTSITAQTQYVDCATGGASSDYANAVLTDAPVSYWRLGDTCGTAATDQKGANPGTYVNSPILGTASLITTDPSNTAATFDATRLTSVAVATPSAGLAPTGPYSLEAWIKPGALPAAGAFCSLVSKPDAYSLQFNGPKLEFTRIAGGTKTRLQSADNAVSVGAAHHVVATFDGTTQRLYLDGAPLTTTTVTASGSAGTSALHIGSWDGSNEFFSGVIDEVAVYGRTLTPQQVGNHYSLATTGGNQAPAAPSSLTASATSAASVHVGWTDNATNATDDILERSTSSTFATGTVTAFDFPLGSTSYDDNGLTTGTTYYYRVKSRNSFGDSPYSNTASATPTGSGTYASAVLNDGPVGYWRLGETTGTTAADARNLDNGTYTNGPTLGAASLLATDTTNTAVHLDGVNDSVAIPDSATLDLTNNFTVETWIKPDTIPVAGSFASVVTKQDAYTIQFNGPKLEFTVIQNGARKRLQAPAGAVVAGSTYDVVATFDGTTQRLYLNGSQVASAALSGSASATTLPMHFGSWDGSNEFLTGTIDEVALYNKTLTPTAIGAHWSAAAGSTTTVNAPSNLTASAASSSQVTATWTDNSSNEANFVLDRSTSSSFTSPVSVTLPANTTSYSDTTVSASTAYYYRVKAVNGSVSSAYSAAATATTPAATTTSSYASTVLADGPVMYCRLGEASGTTIVDQTGATSGTYVNGPTLGSPSLLTTDTANTAVRFNGTSQYGSIPDRAALRFGSAFTVEAWIKPTAIPAAGAFASIVTKAEAYSLQLNGPRLEFTVIQSGTRRRLQAASGAIVAGSTYHIVATYDGTTQRLYINGTQVTSAALTGAASSTTTPVMIGSWDGSSEYFNGTIDEVALYNKALTAQQVTAHRSAAG